ncbi:MAG: MarR family winged helix-turn-helix transcriptional regulator [Chloroflexota bacterium]
MAVKSEPLKTDDLRIAGTIMLLSRMLEQNVRLLSPEDQMSIGEVSVLAHVSRGNVTPSGIARAMRLDPGRVTRLTDRLVALGYLWREEDASDRRRCLLHVTPTGETRLERGRVDLTAAVTELLDGLSMEDRRQLEQGLTAMRQVVDEMLQGPEREG